MAAVAACLISVGAAAAPPEQYRLVIKPKGDHRGWLEIWTPRGWRPNYYLQQQFPGGPWQLFELNPATGDYHEVPNGGRPPLGPLRIT